jgi:Tol biopolymer transport system component
MRMLLVIALVVTTSVVTHPSTSLGAGQAPPATEIYLAPIGGAAGVAINISHNPGYDNQPSFLPDGSAVLFSSQRDGKQMDIYRYDIATRALSPVTKTPESEYSPLVTPDGKTFSVIRVEADGAQRLWRFDLNGSNPRVVLENVRPVGYHVWVDDTHLALFVLGGQGQPNSLQYADTATGKAEVIDTGIGRSLLRRPRTGTVSYVSKPAEGRWVVKEFDPRTRAIATITETADVNSSEDCAWLPDGRLLMASGARILAWPGGSGWAEFAQYPSAGAGRITRMAVSPRWIAFVR